jgi:hypothetical protein
MKKIERAPHANQEIPAPGRKRRMSTASPGAATVSIR